MDNELLDLLHDADFGGAPVLGSPDTRCLEPAVLEPDVVALGDEFAPQASEDDSVGTVGEEGDGREGAPASPDLSGQAEPLTYYLPVEQAEVDDDGDVIMEDWQDEYWGRLGDPPARA